MKKRIFAFVYLLPLLLIFLIYGCSQLWLGKEFDYRQVHKIVRGTSTQMDIPKIFGEPLSVRKTETGEVWNYYMSVIGVLTSNFVSLDIYFDKSGIVIDYIYRKVKRF